MGSEEIDAHEPQKEGVSPHLDLPIAVRYWLNALENPAARVNEKKHLFDGVVTLYLLARLLEKRAEQGGKPWNSTSAADILHTALNSDQKKVFVGTTGRTGADLVQAVIRGGEELMLGIHAKGAELDAHLTANIPTEFQKERRGRLFSVFDPGGHASEESV